MDSDQANSDGSGDDVAMDDLLVTAAPATKIRPSAPIIADALSRMRNLDKVEIVVLDFDSMLHRIVLDVFGAVGRTPTIIIDKRHVLEVVRMPMAGYITRWLHGGNRAHDKTGHPLNAQTLRGLLNNRPHKVKEMAMHETLGAVLQAHPDLAAVYRVKEDFYTIFSRRSRPAAEGAFDTLRNSLSPALRGVYGSAFEFIQSRREHVFAYFDHFVTSAGTEARNGHVKDLYRQGRGCSAQVLKARSLAKYGYWTSERIRAAVVAWRSGEELLPIPSLAFAEKSNDIRLKSAKPQKSSDSLPLMAAADQRVQRRTPPAATDRP